MTSANFTDGVQFATIELSLGVTDSLLQFKQSPDLPNRSDVFDADEGQKVLDFTAAISAVQSGVIFASKKAGVKNVLITILSLKGYVGDEGYTGFAVAATREFLKQANIQIELGDPSSEGWSVVEGHSV